MVHFNYLPEDVQQELKATAEALMAPGKGLLASDETADYMGQRFAKFGLTNSEETRRAYRQMIYTAGPELSHYISGIILLPETLYQKADNGVPFVKLLANQNIIAGVNVDKGLVPLMGTDGETTTQGLDDLGQRCAQYYKDGARFAKLRSAYKISQHTPSPLALLENANLLARYASICQQNRLVPVVEPDILLDGDHDLERCQKVLEKVLASVYKALNDHHVYLEGTVLKTSMVTPGRNCSKKATPQEVGKATVTALRRTMPTAVPGLGFLSGGQGEEEATLNLNGINQEHGKKPWRLTYCYGRAMVAHAFESWKGKKENEAIFQKELLNRAKANSLASQGKYSP